MNTLRPGLPPLPPRMQHLEVDDRGFPVPWFVAIIDGKPDHRVMDSAKVSPALRYDLCWQCGKPLGVYKSFLIGPMCAITRTISEPPSHIECLRYACTACPFLSRPHAHRREKGLPETSTVAEAAILRNPGVSCIWTTRKFRTFPALRQDGGQTALFEIGDADSTEWFAEGRQATRAEVDESVVSGLPILLEEARERDGPAGLAELRKRLFALHAMLDVVLPWPDPGPPTPQEDALTQGFLAATKFGCTALVLDLQYDPGLLERVTAQIKNKDALKSIALARDLPARYVVVAGQLHKEDQGAFSAMVMGDDVDALAASAVAAHARMGELGETYSQWTILLPEKAKRDRVQAALAMSSFVEGSA